MKYRGFSTEHQDSTGTAIHIGRVFDLQNWMFPSVKAEQDISGDVGGNNDVSLEWLKNLVGSALDDKWFVLVCVLVFLWFVVSLVRILGKIEININYHHILVFILVGKGGFMRAKGLDGHVSTDVEMGMYSILTQLG